MRARASQTPIQPPCFLTAIRGAILVVTVNLNMYNREFLFLSFIGRSVRVALYRGLTVYRRMMAV